MQKHFLARFFIFFLFAVLLAGCGITGQNEAAESTPAGQLADSGGDEANLDLPNNNEQPEETAGQSQEGPIPMIIDKTKKYSAVISTDAGDIEIEMAADKTPITVNNFVSLSKDNFYDGTIFHRTIRGFMIQGGDPEGTGMGGPGYQFDDEPFEGEYARGTVAMANAGPNTNGSQFFIMQADRPLPKSYVIFGKVANGLETVDKIAEAEVEMSPSGEMSKPVNPIKVKSIRIIEE